MKSLNFFRPGILSACEWLVSHHLSGRTKRYTHLRIRCVQLELCITGRGIVVTREIGFNVVGILSGPPSRKVFVVIGKESMVNACEVPPPGPAPWRAVVFVHFDESTRYSMTRHEWQLEVDENPCGVVFGAYLLYVF